MASARDRRHVRLALMGPSLSLFFDNSFYTVTQRVSRMQDAHSCLYRVSLRYISLSLRKNKMLSAFHFYNKSLHIIFWTYVLLTFYVSQVNVNLFSVSVVTLTEELQSHRATGQHVTT